jgi:hypothetical protein
LCMDRHRCEQGERSQNSQNCPEAAKMRHVSIRPSL